MTINRLVASMGRGLLLAAPFAMTLAALRFVFPDLVPEWLIVALVLAGPLVMGLLALVQKSDPLAPAREIDRQLGLHDRITTAIEFSQQKASHPFAAMQLADAVAHMQRVKPSRVVPLRIGRSVWVGCLLAVFAIGGGFWPIDATTDNTAEVARQEAESRKQRKEILVERTTRDREAMPVSQQLPFGHRDIVRRYFSPSDEKAEP
jgi:hypothetical protein